MIICRRCHDFEGNEELEIYVKNYVNHLSEKQKCNDIEYQHRLSFCEACDKLINGMCCICGCFVLVRAAKKHMNCPYPYNNKWNI